MSYLSRRRVVGASIVAFWSVMTGLLLRDQFGARHLTTRAVASEPLREVAESWLSISLAEGRRVGTIHLRQAPEERDEQPGASMRLAARLGLQLLGKPTDLEISGFVWRPYGVLPEDSPLAVFEFVVLSAGFDFEVKGEVADGELRGQIVSAGETLPLRLPVDDSVIFSSGMGSAMRLPLLEPGSEVFVDSFDPLTLSKSRARVRCTAKEILRSGSVEIATRRLVVETNGLSSTAWIDELGEVVRAETPIGLIVERLEANEAAVSLPALEETGTEAIDDLLGHTAVGPTGQRPFRGARSMTVQLAGLENPALPEDRVQTALGDGRYRIRTPVHSAPEARRNPAAPAASGNLSRYLAADPFIQADHPRIVARAAAITARETDPWTRAVAIHDWVFLRLEKEPVLSIPSALEVLEQRRGDCNEHTVLFTALARANGLPTRIAIGIVWSDELGGFYYHAWPEVFLGDWVWMDPTLDQPFADATHIKLLNGGIESWPRLLPYLGELAVEVLNVE